MQLRFLIIGSILFLSFEFSSCTKDASENYYARLPEYKQKLAITAFVSPDQNPNEIYVTTNLPRFGERTFQDLGQLKLFLYEDLNEVKLDTICKKMYEINYYYYINNFRFKEGHSYSLRVKSEAGFEAVASCKIPPKHNLDIKVDTTSRKMNDEWGRNLLIPIARVSIRDIEGEQNYYRMVYNYNVYKKFKGSYSKTTDNPITPVRQRDLGDVMYNDNGRDGQRIILRTIEFNAIETGAALKNNDPDSAFLSVYVLSTDKPYNDFHLSLLNYTAGDDPFTEPSFLYSNVEGGVGIFASYVVDSLIYRLK